MEDRLVTLATDHYTAAEVLKARLESVGIECYLKHVNLLQGAVSEGVKVQIKESDVEKALRLMMEIKAEQEKEEIKDIKKLRRILVPVDFSEFSKNACIYALNLAKKYEAEVKILHIYYAPIVDLVPITDAYSIQVDMDINLREMEHQARKKLINFVNEIRAIARDIGLDTLKIGYALREGIVEDEVASMARSYKPGIIVMGSKGKGEKQSDIVGSVVYRVLDRTPVPVLAIPEHNVLDDLSRMRNVVYATEFDDGDLLAIRRLMGIIAAFNTRIYCVNVSKSDREEWVRARMDALKTYFKDISKRVKVECHVLSGGDPLESLESFCELNNIDMIAISNKKRGLLLRIFDPGITRKLIKHSNVPLLIFRA